METLEAVGSFFANTKEVKGWGWNSLTFTFLATVFFTFVQAWGLYLQTLRVWREKSAASVAVVMLWYLCFYFVAFCIYGVHENSFAMVFNSGLSLLHIPILIGIIKFRKMTKVEIAGACLSVLPVIAMTLSPRKDLVFFVSFLVAIVLIAEQPFEIWYKRTPGAVEPKAYVLYVVSATFWLLYAIVIRDWVIMTLNPVLLVIFVATIVLCRKPKTKNEKKESRGNYD